MGAETAEKKEASAGVNLEQAKLDLERWRAEEDIKLRTAELEVKRKETSKAVWSSPLLIAVIGLVATLLASIVQNILQGNASRELERTQSEATRELEQRRFESSLIQKAVDTDDPDKAAQRLQLLLSLGFITDKDGKIASYVSHPETIPLQPEADTPREATPGRDRWAVKTGGDPDVGSVDTQHRVGVTVEELTQIPRPAEIPLQRFPNEYQNSRAAGVERTVYTVEAEIVAYKEEDDGDYHLEIRGQSGQAMVAEIPNPDPKFEDKLKPTRRIQKAIVRARITGIGFFDIVHGQLGMAPNGLELHPVIGIEFLNGDQ